MNTASACRFSWSLNFLYSSNLDTICPTFLISSLHFLCSRVSHLNSSRICSNETGDPTPFPELCWPPLFAPVWPRFWFTAMQWWGSGVLLFRSSILVVALAPWEVVDEDKAQGCLYAVLEVFSRHGTLISGYQMQTSSTLKLQSRQMCAGFLNLMMASRSGTIK